MEDWEKTRVEFERKQPKRIITYKGTGIQSHMIYEIFDLGEQGAYFTETNPKLDPRYARNNRRLEGLRSAKE